MIELSHAGRSVIDDAAAGFVVIVAKVVGLGMNTEMPSAREADVCIWKMLYLTIDR